ncbi:MAG: DUF445 family protein [Gemmatimonadales bacterium]
MTGGDVLHLVMTVAFGALAGGLTNAVAIWMLFHPHQPRGPRFLRIQGAIPKNHERLAKTIGRTVGQRLLTPSDLAEHLGSGVLRQSFDQAVGAVLHDLLTRERKSLREELPPAARAEVDRLAAAVGPSLAATLAGRPDLAAGIGGWLARQRERLAADHTPLLDRLPPDLIAAVERGVAAYLPLALERVAVALRNPDARGRIEGALHDIYARLLQDLMLHQRVMARLVMTEKTITRLLDSFSEQGADDLARLLDEPAMRAHVARAVNDAMVRFLRRPLATHLDTLGAERLARAEQSLTAWLASAAQSAPVIAGLEDAVTRGLNRLLNIPVGRLVDRLGNDTAARLPALVAPPLWEWIQGQIPGIVTQLDIPTMVEQKVRGFSLDRMEEIVRATTQRELDLIVRLGYLLGGIIGVMAWLTGRWVG